MSETLLGVHELLGSHLRHEVQARDDGEVFQEVECAVQAREGDEAFWGL